MQLTEAIEAKEQPPEFVFPSEHAFNRPEALFKYRRLKQRLAASLGLFSAARIRVDVGDHATIENGLAVTPTIVDAIQTDDAALKIHAHLSGDTR